MSKADEPLTTGRSIVELIIAMGVPLVLGGFAVGGLSANQDKLEERVDEKNEQIVAIQSDVSQVKQEQAAIKAQVKAIDDRTIRILDAVDRINQRLPNGH